MKMGESVGTRLRIAGAAPPSGVASFVGPRGESQFDWQRGLYFQVTLCQLLKGGNVGPTNVTGYNGAMGHRFWFIILVRFTKHPRQYFVFHNIIGYCL